MKDRGSNPRWRVFFFLLPCSLVSLIFLFPLFFRLGGVAHMVEHSLCMRGARGSIPRISMFFLFLLFFFLYAFSLTSLLFSLQKTTTAGFEPTLPEGNRLAGDRLNHSATLPFVKKRQWQDLNLRIQRIIDFKSIALDHSATLSSCSFRSLLYLFLLCFD